MLGLVWLNEKVSGSKSGYIPSVHDRHNTSLPVCNLHKSGLRHVEVCPWGIAPPAIVGVLGPIRRADVGGSYGGYWVSSVAPLGPDASNLVTSPTRVPVFKQGRAERCSVSAVAAGEEVPVSTSPT